MKYLVRDIGDRIRQYHLALAMSSGRVIEQERERVRVCVCVFVRERERERERENEFNVI